MANFFGRMLRDSFVRNRLGTTHGVLRFQNECLCDAPGEGNLVWCKSNTYNKQGVELTQGELGELGNRRDC